jgi:hypothetical protein
MPSEFIESVVQTVRELMLGGVHDPSAAEIAKAHTGRAGTPPHLYRECLISVRDELAKSPTTATVHLVSSMYYDEYRDAEITHQTAPLCAAIGQRAEGVRIANAKDAIWHAVQMQNMKAGTGKTKKAVEASYESAELGAMSPEELSEVVQVLQDVVRVAYTAQRWLRLKGHSTAPLFDGLGGDGEPPVGLLGGTQAPAEDT